MDFRANTASLCPRVWVLSYHGVPLSSAINLEITQVWHEHVHWIRVHFCKKKIKTASQNNCGMCNSLSRIPSATNKHPHYSRVFSSHDIFASIFPLSWRTFVFGSENRLLFWMRLKRRRHFHSRTFFNVIRIIIFGPLVTMEYNEVLTGPGASWHWLQKFPSCVANPRLTVFGVDNRCHASMDYD